MSFWKYVFDSDAMQRHDIERLRERSRRQARLSASQTRRNHAKVDDMRERLDELEEQVGGLQLMNRVLIELLRERGDWDEDAFKRKVYEVDMEDGKLDGKVTSD